MVFCLLLFALGGNGLAQDDWLYPPQPEFASELKEIREILELGDFHTAKERYLKLAEENPQTSIGGHSLYSAAMVAAGALHDREGAAELLTELAEQYPESRFEVAARRVLLSYELGSEPSHGSMTDALGGLAGILGGVPFHEIISGNDVRQAIPSLGAHSLEFRLALSDLYIEVFYGLIHGSRQAEAMAVARFGRAAFDRVLIHETFRECIEYAAAHEANEEAYNFGSEPSVPEIGIVNPEPGDTVRRSFALRVELMTGSFRKAGVDTGKTNLLVDDTPVDIEPVITSLIDTSLSEDSDFEVLTLEYPLLLTPGQHTATIRTQSYPPREGGSDLPPVNELSWSFTVSDESVGENLTVMNTRDSIIVQKNPHLNEGANAVLILEKITGKAARDVVGFDLSNIQTSGLTRASPGFKLPIELFQLRTFHVAPPTVPIMPAARAIQSTLAETSRTSAKTPPMVSSRGMVPLLMPTPPPQRRRQPLLTDEMRIIR